MKDHRLQRCLSVKWLLCKQGNIFDSSNQCKKLGMVTLSARGGTVDSRGSVASLPSPVHELQANERLWCKGTDSAWGSDTWKLSSSPHMHRYWKQKEEKQTVQLENKNNGRKQRPEEHTWIVTKNMDPCLTSLAIKKSKYQPSLLDGPTAIKMTKSTGDDTRYWWDEATEPFVMLFTFYWQLG